MSNRKRAVIIGGGIAGVQAASSLKEMDVTLISNEPFLPYYRMRIEEILGGKDVQSLYIHPRDWYEGRGIEYLEGNVSLIEKDAVLLDDGKRVTFDRLLIATGSQARRLELPGDRKESFVLRTASDAIALRKVLENADSFTVVGGGLLGLEAAYSAACDFHIPVNVIETAPYILPRQLDEDSAILLQQKLAENGVSVIVSGEIESADDHFVYLKDGRKVQSAVLCFSVGVNPGKDIAAASGIATDRGILVDSHLRTSMENVWAAGDAVQLGDRTFGLAVYAREMGIAAASSMMGEAVDYVPSEPSALLKVGGIDVVSLGLLRGEKIVEASGDTRKTFYVEDGILKGAILINDKASMMKVKAMIGREYGRA